MLDRSASDNDLDLDLSFTDQEIIRAMQRAARAFNSLPPLVMTVTYNCMPLDTNIFLDATVEQLLLAELMKLRRNDIDYNAGGVATNLTAKRITNYEKAIKELGASWRDVASKIKIAYNLSLAFGAY